MENNDKKDKEPIITKIIDMDDLSHTFSKEEVEENSKYAILSYIGFLFLIPIFNKTYKQSKYVLFHVNQGFNLFAVEIFVFIVLGLLNTIFVKSIQYTPVWLSVMNFLLYSIVVILMLLGIVNSINGKSKELPLIGKYRYIK